MTFVLRPYQTEAIDALDAELRRVNSTLLVAAVGAGKTVMQAAFIQRVIGGFPKARFVCAVHTRELVTQNYGALIKAWPGAPAGINSAALGRRQVRSQILFCSIQSVYRKAPEIGHVDCLFVDECHLIPEKSTTMYRRFIDDLLAINPEMRLVGMSGTPFRMNMGMLTDGDDALFKSVAFEIGIAELVQQKHLTPAVSKRPGTLLDTSGVAVRGGEFVAGELERAVNRSEITQAAVAETIAFGKDRKAWLAFCTGVDHARDVRDEFRRQGVSCEMIEGTMPAADRASIISRFKAGQIRCLTNINVLSIGFDYPGIDLIALMRPTKSPALYIQQCGRGLRLSPGKQDVLVLDFAQVIFTHGPIDSVIVKGRRKSSDEPGEAPSKTCPECDEILLIAARECPCCGFEFPPSEAQQIDRTASTEAIMNLTATDNWMPVRDVSYERHRKHGSPDSMRVDYLVGFDGYRVASEWVCFEHGGFARQKAVGWWHQWAGTAPPNTVGEALERLDEVRRPGAAVLVREGKYHRISRLRLGAVEEVAA